MALIVEAAVDSFGDARAAEAEGVDRIELCGTLHDGAVTPSSGLIGHCLASLRTPIHVFIRPRTGNFVYDADDVAIMRADVAIAGAHGAPGVVIGALTDDGRVDARTMRELVQAAGPMTVGFHRAFDEVRDQFDALDVLIDLGVSIVLTSGGAPTAIEGADRLKALVQHAAGRIAILAGGSVRPDNVRALVARSGVSQVHGKAFRGLARAFEASA